MRFKVIITMTLILLTISSICYAGLIETPIDIPGYNGCSVAWGDYDNDGDLDLAFAGDCSSGSTWVKTTKIYRNNGGGSFTDSGLAFPGVSWAALAWGITTRTDGSIFS